MELIDSFGRKINYLRLSVTDRCNMRCRYCMPAEGVKKLHRKDILSYEELFRIARAVGDSRHRKDQGYRRGTTCQKGHMRLPGAVSRHSGLKQLVLTTNGLRLEAMAEDLRVAGVQRLNISLDSLQPELFARITRGGDLSRVLAGIAAAEKCGFPIKINMVVMRGVNDAEIVKFASLAIRKPYTVRFIEYMPVFKEKNWQSLAVPGSEILARIGEHYTCIPVGRRELSGPAREYRLEGGVGTIGVITPISGHFCERCNRIRVTSTGVARGCLLSNTETDLKPYIRTFDRLGLQEALRRIVTNKPGKHQISDQQAEHSPFPMARVGG